MIPRNLSRPILLAASLTFIALGSTIPARTENATVPQGANHIFTKAFCTSEQDKPVVYFSKIFDVDITVPTIDTQPLVNGYIIHLKEKYDYQTNNNYPVLCPLYKTLGEAEATRRKMQGQAQPTAKQIVEDDWIPPAWAQPLQSPGGPGFFPPAPPIPTHTFCAVGIESTMYFSAVFDTLGALNNQKWNDGFKGFLSKQYGAQAEIEPTCTILNTVREAERNLNARVGGVRANKHKAVETGWKFDPTGTYKPMPKPTPKVDDDPEPPPRPTAPTPPPTGQTKDLAVKELPVSLAYCQNTPSLNGVFICDCFRRLVYNYRIEHPTGPPEPLASLVAGEKLAWSECIDNIKVGKWVSDRATAQKLDQRAINCTTQKFIVGFYAQPKLNRMKELYNESVAACNK